jgi:hypothetical protein
MRKWLKKYAVFRSAARGMAIAKMWDRNRKMTEF